MDEHRDIDEQVAEQSADATDAGAVPGRRRFLFGVGAGLLALVLLIGVPLFLTSRTAYFANHEGTEKAHETWSTSTHAEAECDNCHVAPSPVSRAMYRARMVGEFYVSLVGASNADEIFGTPNNDACIVCHADLRGISPEGDIQIPHRAHVEILKIPCVDCHRYVTHDVSPEGKHTPTMAGCLKCHDGKIAKDDCSACHTEKDAPATHKKGDWLVAHAAQATNPECVTCHKWAERWCADCHSQRPKSHGADWRKMHGEAVKKHRNCEACHAGAFCVKCHGELPKQNLDPKLKLIE